jgi:hypothetical protein
MIRSGVVGIADVHGIASLHAPERFLAKRYLESADGWVEIALKTVIG